MVTRKKALVLLILLYFAHISKPENLAGEIAHAAAVITQTSSEPFSSRKRLGEILGDRNNPEGRSLGVGKTKNGVEMVIFRPRDEHIYNVSFQHDHILVSISFDRFTYRKRGVQYEVLRQELIKELSKFFGQNPTYGERNEAMWARRIYDGSTRIVRLRMSATPVMAFRSNIKNSILISEKENISISLRIDYVTSL